MKIAEVLRDRRYAALAAVSAVVFAAFYIYTQVLGIVQNVDLWFTVIPWYNAVLFTVFAALFGITLSFQVYTWRQPKVCAPAQQAKSGGVSGAATFSGLLVAQCPACASIAALFLPVSATAFFVSFGPVINVISIGLLLFALRYLGAFRPA